MDYNLMSNIRIVTELLSI